MTSRDSRGREDVEILEENFELGADCTLWFMNLGISRLVRNIAGKYGAYDKVELGFPKQGLNLETLQA
jgi:hypothetical protein